jgi:dynein heavy chain
MDEVSYYVFKECKPMLPVSEESLFISCLSLLGAVLNENTNIGSEMHIERLFLFCLIWTFGAVLDQADQKGFSDLLYKVVTALPDDDLKNSVFEYYVDETGEWDTWSQRYGVINISAFHSFLKIIY